MLHKLYARNTASCTIICCNSWIIWHLFDLNFGKCSAMICWRNWNLQFLFVFKEE